jgi:CheY-like chemotaxis protein
MPPANVCHTGATILVADDDVLTRIAIADYLRDCGYRVIEASGGIEAKTALTHVPEIRILFADTRLAGDENGFALAQWARRNRPALEVVLSTGLMRKAEAAARLCSHNHTSPPASHLRERIEAMTARHGRRIRNTGKGKPRAVYYR